MPAGGVRDPVPTMRASPSLFIRLFVSGGEESSQRYLLLGHFSFYLKYASDEKLFIGAFVGEPVILAVLIGRESLSLPPQ